MFNFQFYKIYWIFEQDKKKMKFFFVVDIFGMLIELKMTVFSLYVRGKLMQIDTLWYALYKDLVCFFF